MPSLIGMGSQSFQNHVHFFTNVANMTFSELRPAILKQPSLLQYSINATLQPKLDYLLHTLSIPISSIPRIIKTSPATLGLSFPNLNITISTIQTHCDLSLEQIGIIVSTSPPILTLGWKTKIEPMLVFLSKALYLQSKSDLGFMIQFAPRILLQNIQRSIIPKLQMLEQAVEQELGKEKGETNSKTVFSVFDAQMQELMEVGVDVGGNLSKVYTALMMRRNPSLLCTTNDIFRRRLGKWNLKQEQPSSSQKVPPTLVEEFAPTNRGRKRLFSPLNISNPNSVVQKMNVKEVDSNFRPKIEKDKSSIIPRALVPVSTSKKTRKKIYEWDRISILEEVSLDTPKKKRSPSKLENDKSPTPITVYVSGSVFPTDNIKEVRGQRRSGGISLYFPQIHHQDSPSLQRLFESCSESCFGTIMPKTKGGDGTDYSCGIVSLGFPFLRPSRNRCDLYSCYAALKVIAEMLQQVEDKDGRLKDANFHIDICTDSGYAWTLLQQSDRLAHLGQNLSLDDFCHAYQYSDIRQGSNVDGASDNHKYGGKEIKTSFNREAQILSYVNPDLMYAICLTLRKVAAGKNNIRFIHSGEMLGQNLGLDFSNQMTFFSKRAAMWQYSRTKTIQ